MIIALSILVGLIAIALIITILLQSGRGGGLAGAFGGSFGASSVFGGHQAADFLTKLTAGLAIAFVVVVLLINVMATQNTGQRPSSVIPQEAAESTPVGGSGMPTTPPPGSGQQVPPGGGQQAPPTGGELPPTGGQTPPAGGGQ